VGWILVGPRHVPSARIEGYNLHDWLNANGHESTIIHAPPFFSQELSIIPQLFKKYDIIVFQKVFAGIADQAMRWYKHNNIVTIFYITDLVMGIDGAVYFSDKTIMSSSFMANCVMEKHKKRVVLLKDAYESPKDFYKTDYKSDKLKVLWFGTARVLKWVEMFRKTIEDEGCEFITICEGDRATKRWNEKEIHNDIKNADVVFIPSPLDGFEKCKDENKLVQAMVIGLPVIAYQVPAYMELYNRFNPHPFCIAATPEDVVMNIRLLKDWELRKEIGQWARECVKDDYHIDSIGKKFLDILWNTKKEVDDAKRRTDQFTLNI